MHRDQPPHEPAAISPERGAEAEQILHRVTRWAAGHPDIVDLLLVGSYARDVPRPDSDSDLVLLTTDRDRYVDNAWADDLALGDLIRVQSWGAVTEVPTRPELERFCFLDDDDRDLIALRRTDAHRLGMAVQICTVRYVGRFLGEDPLAVPWCPVPSELNPARVADLRGSD